MERFGEEYLGTITSFNDFAYKVLFSSGLRLGLDEQQYTLDFDRLELLMALNMLQHPNPVARYPRPVRCLNSQNWDRLLEEIKVSLSEQIEESPYVRSGIFGRTARECLILVDRYRQALEPHRPQWARYQR